MTQVTRLKDIAIAAKVSIPVVSNILNNKGRRFSSETREKVLRLAREMNYNPAFSGRSLATGRSYNIGLLMPVSYASTLSGHYLNIFHGLSLVVEQTDYNLIVFFGGGKKYLRKIKQGRVDGVIIMESIANDEDICSTLETGLPAVVVNLDYDVGNCENVSCVRSDHENMVSECFKYFIETGCKRILNINNYRRAEPNKIIFEEFKRQCVKYSCRGVFGSSFCPFLELSEFSTQLRNMFTSGQKWDAYFVNGSYYADILLKIAREFGFEQKRDFQLFVSSTDTLRMNFNYPCYLHSQREMGRIAWSLLQKMMAGEKLPEKKILVKYRSCTELQAPGHFGIDIDWSNNLLKDQTSNK
jgi:DNA-binding LacI/PurR family transcriptional regulator